jgi:hypothetical protein
MYVQSITLKGSRIPARVNRPAAELTLPVDGAERLVVALAPGAASIQGQVRAVQPHPELPGNFVIYLVPGESKEQTDPLRFAETTVTPEGKFSITNMAPGSYKLSLRGMAPQDLNSSAQPPAWLVPAERSKLLADATRAVRVELAACKGLNGYSLPYLPTGNRPK